MLYDIILQLKMVPSCIAISHTLYRFGYDNDISYLSMDGTSVVL